MITKRVLFIIGAIALITTCAGPPAKSGVDLANFDNSVRPQDDFYQYVNGTWLSTTEIPSDRTNYGSFGILRDLSEARLRTIIEEIGAKDDLKPGAEAQQIGHLYQAYMDSALVESLGIKPIEGQLDKIAALSGMDDVASYMASSFRSGIGSPFILFVGQDGKEATRYISHIYQGGLGLPDRSYYLKEGEPYAGYRSGYISHIEKMFGFAGQTDAATKATKVMEIESAIADVHWERVDNRDRDKTYNKYKIADLGELLPAFNWDNYIKAAGISGETEIIIYQPTYIEGLNDIFNKFSVDAWKTYFTWKLLDQAAALLPNNFVQADFEFYSKTLRGQSEIRPRWKRAVGAVNGSLGEAVGKVYVERHFPPAAKKKMDKLVKNLRVAMKEGINGLEWMGDDTKEQARAKLVKFSTKIGYPDVWKDYAKLEIKKDDLVGNMRRSTEMEYDRSFARLGGPIDRTIWGMFPQTVNAYYNSSMNEIVFPAAILQPPFFDMDADDAVNYGGIGAVIGHEISHGFDDQGRKSNGDGNLVDWWTEEDGAEFTKRAQVMIDQYNALMPIPDTYVNGQLTLGENIGDLGGMTVAYKAYRHSLGGKEAPVIDGFTGEQRFFIGWAQVWRSLYREAALRQRIMTDPHSPNMYRTNAVLANMPEFYEAFGVTEADSMFRAEDIRVKIW